MSNLLLWLALPMLIIPWLARADRIGGGAGQLVMAGIGLAALHQGAGTLDPRDLRIIADQSPHDAWFVGITAGAMLSGGCLLPDIRNWRKIIVALPLLIALLDMAVPHVVPLALGLIVGSVPAMLGRLVGRPRPASTRDARQPAPLRWSLAIAVATVVAALWGPAVLAMLGLAVLAWREWSRYRSAGGPVLAVAAALLLAGWTWLAVTVAGAIFPSLRSIGMEAPISPAAGEGLALLAIGWGIAIAAPWPLDRFARVAVQLPVLAVVLHLAGMHVTPDGIAHWQPVLTTMLVVATLVALASDRRDGAAAAVVVLGATRSGAVPFTGAAMMAFVPAIGLTGIPARLRSTVVALATAFVLAGVLQDEVLLAVITALGVTALANRADHLVARVSGPVHL